MRGVVAGRGIRVGGGPEIGSPAGGTSVIMAFRGPAVFVFVCLLHILFKASLAHGAVITQPATTDSTLGTDGKFHCVKDKDWVGDRFLKTDCRTAISDFSRTNVEPRRYQEYEFLTRGVPRVSYLPYIVTPKEYDYGA